SLPRSRKEPVTFFTSFPWWQLEPRDELAGENTLLLADAGRRYVAYLPKSGSAKFTLAAGNYCARWFNPRLGTWRDLPPVAQRTEGAWFSPHAPDAGDWALLLDAK
ncbi:MAG: hypothetical protein FJ398_10600, partial [Verrucomicrobia bacterium]|nr:hypothetical protein [Verrucomicrobiota bacterium]